MDLTKILETIVSTVSPTATVNINIGTPGAPIYNCFGGVQMINPSNTSSSRKKKKEDKEEDKSDAIQINLEDDNTAVLDDYIPFSDDDDEFVVDTPPQEQELNSPVSDLDQKVVNVDSMLEEAVNDYGLDTSHVAVLKLWAIANLDSFNSAFALAVDDFESTEGVDDIYTCLKNVGWEPDPND